MADYLDSILMNGFAELGNITGWSSIGASIVSDSERPGRCFQLSESAYMMQDVPTVLFSRPSSNYLYKMSYRRMVIKDPLKLVVDAFVTLRWKYSSGAEDLVSMPLGNNTVSWADLTVPYSLRENDKLVNISLLVQTDQAEGSFRVDDLQLLPSSYILEPEEVPDSGNNYEKFRELSILYGPEANLPELG